MKKNTTIEQLKRRVIWDKHDTEIGYMNQCSCCNSQYGLKFIEPTGYICRFCWMDGPRCRSMYCNEPACKHGKGKCRTCLMGAGSRIKYSVENFGGLRSGKPELQQIPNKKRGMC